MLKQQEELKKLQVKVEQEFSKTGLKLPTGGKEKLVKEVTEGAARLVGALDQGLQAREALYTEQNRKLAEKKGEAFTICRNAQEHPL